MPNQDMLTKVRTANGFIAALDQSGGSTPGALKGYGYKGDEWSSEDEMYGLVHKMRVRIISSPVFNGDKVLGAILFERTMDGEANGQPVPAYLWSKGVVPFLKIDKGLADEANGVQLMKPNPDLDQLLERAVAKGIFGTKERSVIHLANPQGIADVVAQQFEVGQQVLSHGLVPIIEPEVNIKSAERAQADEILRDEILKHLDRLPEGSEVMLKLSIPAKPRHVRRFGQASARASRRGSVGRFLAYGRLPRACEEYGHDRQFLPRFAGEPAPRHQRRRLRPRLGEAIDEIYEASTDKVAA